jgi:hypothetical protein
MAKKITTDRLGSSQILESAYDDLFVRLKQNAEKDREEFFNLPFDSDEMAEYNRWKRRKAKVIGKQPPGYCYKEGFEHKSIYMHEGVAWIITQTELDHDHLEEMFLIHRLLRYRQRPWPDAAKGYGEFLQSLNRNLLRPFVFTDRAGVRYPGRREQPTDLYEDMFRQRDV